MYTSPLIKETTTNFQNWIIYGKRYRTGCHLQIVIFKKFLFFFTHHILPFDEWFSLFVSFNRRCPPGHMVKANSTGKFCMYTLCASRPCHRGTCVAQSPSKFTCHCPEGYRGPHCEVTLAIYRDDVGLSFSSLFAICICFLALLGIYLQHVLLKKKEIKKKITYSPS